MKHSSRNHPGRPALLGALVLGLVATAALGRTRDDTILMRADLKGNHGGYGSFSADLSKDHGFLTYNLTYADLEGDVQEAILHSGQTGENGGVATYLCSNLAHAPDGTPECPGPRAGTVSGRISASDAPGPEAQGAYVVIGTNEFPDGEIAGPIDVE
jgi:hypothetical protein